MLKAGLDEIEDVDSDGVDAFGLDVFLILVHQFESGAEFGFFQGGEGVGDLVGHAGVLFGPGNLVPLAI